MATKITLRKKVITKGRESLYLDFWPPIPDPKTGRNTRREFLGMYVYIHRADVREKIESRENMGKDTVQLRALYKSLKSLSLSNTQHNAETLKQANTIRRKRENQLNNKEIYIEYAKRELSIAELGELDFIEYFRMLADKRKDSNRNSWISAVHYLESFKGGSLRFADLEVILINDFKRYLLSAKSIRSDQTTLSRNSAAAYFNKFRAALNQAYVDGILQTDLNRHIDPIKSIETSREYLTLQELNKLVEVPCKDTTLKRAALFSALTGLRFLEIQKMTWSDDHSPIPEKAVPLMGDPGEPGEKVFKKLNYSAYSNKHLSGWIRSAGITKDITFQCFRHTFAIQQLFNGTDIFTLSKILGHKDLKTTQVYAEMIDLAKSKKNPPEGPSNPYPDYLIG